MKRKPSLKTAIGSLKVSIEVSPSSVRLVPPTGALVSGGLVNISENCSDLCC